jgi:hypothetical protein
MIFMSCPPLRLEAWPDADHGTRMDFISRDMKRFSSKFGADDDRVEPGPNSLAPTERGLLA